MDTLAPPPQPPEAARPAWRLGLRWAPEGAFLLLALVVAGRALAPGLVLRLDLAQTPRSTLSPAYWGLPAGTNAGSLGRLPFDALLRLAGTLGLVGLAQKLLLVAIVFLAGLGMYRLVSARPAGRLFAGVLYALNPFVYERLIAGQWFLLLSYALVPWAYAAFLDVGRPGCRWAPWRFALLTAVAGFADPHIAALLGVLCLATAALRGWRAFALALGLAIAASLLWLLPTPGLHELWSHVGRAQLDLYATRGDPRWGSLLTVLGLGGFWEDPAPAVTALAAWPLIVLLLVGLSLRGAALFADRRLALAVGLCGLLGAVAALGMASGITRPATLWLMDHVSPLRSFRETDKAVALLAFAYAFLGAHAVDELVGWPRRRALAGACAVLAVAVPAIYGGRELGGAWGALRPASFPTSWQQADALLPHDSRTLFLPFHGYLQLDFAHSRVVYNPAQSFFSAPILAGRSVDQDPRHQDVRDPEQAEVQALLSDPARPDLGRCLAALGVSRVLLAHQADWSSLSALESRADMSVVARWPDLTLLALRSPGSFAMTAPAAQPGPCPIGLEALPSRLESPVRLRLLAAVPAGRRLVLGLPDAFSWRRIGSEMSFAPWPDYRRVYLAALLGWLVVGLSALVVGLRARRRPA